MHTQYQQKSKWSVHLDASNSDYWFIKNHQRLASNKFIYTFVISWTLCIGALLYLLILFNTGVDDFISSCFLVIEFISLCVLWIRIPPFYDAFLIKQEMKYVLALALTATLLLIMWAIKVAIFGYHFWFFMMFQFITGSIVGGMAIIVNIFLFLPSNRYFLEDIQGSPKQQQAILTNKDAFRKKYTLKQTLANEGLIEPFFQHLSCEFSYELLLAFIELTQFRALMKNDDAFMNEIHSQMQAHAAMQQLRRAPMQLSDKLPQSKIVYEEYADMECKVDKYLSIAYDLFMKYIGYRNGAELEINISAPCRAKIASFVNTHCNNIDAEEAKEERLSVEDKYGLFMLFEAARETLYRLMSSSHSRFLQVNTNTIKRVSLVQKLKTPTPVLTDGNLSFSLIDMPTAT